MKIGLVPGSFKPYHAGHDALVRHAASHNSVVFVFYSVSSSKESVRDGLTGEKTSKIIIDYVEKSLPHNVQMIPSTVPVSSVWEMLQKAEKSNLLDDIFTVYSDEVDILKYDKKSFLRWLPNLYTRNQIFAQGLKRGVQTPDVSGTLMRQYIAAKDFKKFSEMLPPSIKKHSKSILDILA